ncbi:MAG: hypothetical protein WBW61_13355, partial [Rhodanobacteraceae bacterium]
RKPERLRPIRRHQQQLSLVPSHARPHLDLPAPLRTTSRVRVSTSSGRLFEISVISPALGVK